MAKMIKMADVKAGDAFYFTNREKLFVQESWEDPEDAKRMRFRLSNGLVVSIGKSFIWYVIQEKEIEKKSYEVFLCGTRK